MNQAPQYYALNIGVAHVDESHYDDNLTPLPCCQRDMLAMKQLAITLEYDRIETLLNETATVANFKSKLRSYSKCLKAGDFLLITYSGHGGRIAFLEKHQPDSHEKIETWCLYDRQLLDKELPELWAGFQEGVTIVLVLDSCHGGGAARGIQRLTKAVGRKAMQNILQKGNETANSNQALYDELRRTYTLSSQKEKVVANFLQLAACKENQLALAGPFMSKYTWELLKLVGDQEFSNYPDLQQYLTERHQQLAHEGQIPVYEAELFGVKTSFFKENAPFVKKGQKLCKTQKEILKNLTKPNSEYIN